MYYKNGLLFISNRQQKNRYVFQWDRTSYSDMYVIDDLNDITSMWGNRKHKTKLNILKSEK